MDQEPDRDNLLEDFIGVFDHPFLIERRDIPRQAQVRGWKLGLKNWLFPGSEDGGRWGRVIFSLIESCKLRRIDPEAYLEDVLVRIATTPPSQIESLMPRCRRPPPLAPPPPA